MQTKLTIPSRIKVGYQKRGDTYTGNLAYVIYFDHKGVLRKETSWKGWCDSKLGSHEFDNVPTEGFVLNKKVGQESRFRQCSDRRRCPRSESSRRGREATECD